MDNKIIVRRPKKNISNSQSFAENFEEYVGYWRANPHRFITEYLGMTLYGFQKQVIYTMDTYNYFIYAASRGLAKSTVTLLFACERCILYPGQRIVVVSYEKGQSASFIEKINEFIAEYPNLANEIAQDGVKTGKNDSRINFKNGSCIIAKTLSEGSRGKKLKTCIILINLKGGTYNANNNWMVKRRIRFS